jgi:hypothetical protein
MSKFRMTVDMSILESLGINLYSNAAAVLSELVANAYDAEATSVKITWDQGSKVVVDDNGLGMTVDQLNRRFLFVGYKKRLAANEGTQSPNFGRKYMGRKGIGKLSVFSIANVVDVYSTRDGNSEGFRIDVDDLKDHIEHGADYEPLEVSVPEEYRKQGTVLVLQSLRTKRADLTTVALRKRLARRFDLNASNAEDPGFSIDVNGNPITYADRQELRGLQFIWEFGPSTLLAAEVPKDVVRFQLDGTVDTLNGWEVTGWFGTAKEPKQLTDDSDAGSLKNIIVLARRRPIQEGIVDKLDFSRIFGNYVTGRISADFLDLDEYEDIATSDRQRLIEDDDRVEKLQQFLRAAFVKAADTWSSERPKKATPAALDRYPKLKDWLSKLPAWQKPAAETMIGTIASLPLERKGEDARVALFRSGVLAFGRVGLRQASQDLDDLSKVTAEDLLPLLGRQSDYEAGLWVDILRSRVEAISKFQDLADADEKEKVLQAHLFANLWLLDASWERATESVRIEQSLRKMAKEDFDLDEETKNDRDRIDIRYATASGRHVIVELKRYSVKTDVEVLKEQGGRYAYALQEVLKKKGQSYRDIEVIFVLGDKPTVKTRHRMNTDDDYIEDSLEQIGGRYVIYDQLIENALAQYQDYLDASETAKALDELLSSIGQDSADAGGPGEPKEVAAEESKSGTAKKATAKKATAKKATAKKTAGKAS